MEDMLKSYFVLMTHLIITYMGTQQKIKNSQTC
jgi:hypothetical protein